MPQGARVLEVASDTVLMLEIDSHLGFSPFRRDWGCCREVDCWLYFRAKLVVYPLVQKSYIEYYYRLYEFYTLKILPPIAKMREGSFAIGRNYNV